jgi:2,3-bisphosphoglycerate-independent phosphoglycerate mutase
LTSPGSTTSAVADRRAGRPKDEECKRLCDKLKRGLGAAVEGCEVFLLPGKEHRFTVVWRGAGLSAGLNDNDPQREGGALIPIRAGAPAAAKAAGAVNAFLKRALEILADEKPTSSGKPANGILLRGFSMLPVVQPFFERYRLRAGAIAAYPMYRGVAQLVGMKSLGRPKNLDEELALLKKHWREFDFFFVHYKNTDTAGHSGQFEDKVKALQELDAAIPAVEDLKPDVLIVTGDHSTPCVHKDHTWHPVPTIIHSALALGLPTAEFSERGLMAGDLGIFEATHLLPLALAHARRFDKYGA